MRRPRSAWSDRVERQHTSTTAASPRGNSARRTPFWSMLSPPWRGAGHVEDEIALLSGELDTGVRERRVQRSLVTGERDAPAVRDEACEGLVVRTNRRRSPTRSRGTGRRRRSASSRPSRCPRCRCGTTPCSPTRAWRPRPCRRRSRWWHLFSGERETAVHRALERERVRAVLETRRECTRPGGDAVRVGRHGSRVREPGVE